ncbi:MAG: hypothetical protein XE11_1213 [Methanomicrobiales archaeon 53_19]|nr:MAG: hypothetical protein XD88_0552 [Methanocalculus sp. 52_23]KUL03498.1 MAG: hypothetical protein XE11_1213 [Methanomicrobiales archaeon 53_19]HIJ06719.1 hypothetical protein [Methanocalculus sp.]
MREIKRQYIMSEDNEPVSVIVDIGTFEKIEEVIEDHGLAHFIINSDDDEPLPRNEAIRYYQRLNGIEDTR